MTALPDVPMVGPGDDIAGLIAAAARDCGEPLADGDILVIAQKIVSKAEGRAVDLADVEPSEAATQLAARSVKDPRLMHLVLDESNEVLRARPGVVIVALHNGVVLANAGIDRSNVTDDGAESVLLLPADPDASAAAIRDGLSALAGVNVGVIIADSIGRAWRQGTIGTAIGAAGVVCLDDLRGRPDLFGRALETTQVGTADELASAASLLLGQAAEGTPVVVIRGASSAIGDGRASDLVRPVELDMFR